MAYYTVETDDKGRIQTAGTIEDVKAIARSVAPTGGSDALIRVTSSTAPSAGTSAGQLVGYRNTAASAVMVAGFSVAAGAGVILEWTGSAWAKAADLAALATGSAPPPADTTPPTAGTLASSSVTATSFTLAISGASDAGGLATAPYAFSTDNGATWSAFQTAPSLAVTGKTASTAYQCKGRAKDAAGNTSDTATITVTTTADTATGLPLTYDFTGTTDTSLVGDTTAGGFTVSAAANTTSTLGVTGQHRPLVHTGTKAGRQATGNGTDVGNAYVTVPTPNVVASIDFANHTVSGTHIRFGIGNVRLHYYPQVAKVEMFNNSVELGNYAHSAPNGTLKLTYDGTTITGYINDQKVGSAAISLTGSTRIAMVIAGGQTAATLSNLRVTVV